ncbi:MAG: tRNA threonylcarbamoyladenosine dehydratase [Ruminococcaceae bacterium]|nr:tRNA threonylcarbamoyladenosine dehydratase [Oscillospiraceae bacterium]
MNEIYQRTESLIGARALERLKNAHVAVFGLGGVGGYAVEALARAGVGSLTLIDNDTVNQSNINRQIIALSSTVGLKKTDAFKSRIADINPELTVFTRDIFFLPESKNEIDFSAFDYVIDAIDTVSGKIAIIEECKRTDVPVISSMGTGNKLDPTAFRITDISKTSVCPLARVMRYELKKRGISKLKVLYSTEEPVKKGNRTPASISFVPSVAGLLIAGEVIKDIIKE